MSAKRRLTTSDELGEKTKINFKELYANAGLFRNKITLRAYINRIL